jgi:hypothetical protein
VSKRRFWDAINYIRPANESQARCENEVVRAFLHVDQGKFLDHRHAAFTNEVYKRKCNAGFRTLRKAEAFIADELVALRGDTNQFLSALESYRERVGQVCAALDKEPKRKGAKQLKYGCQYAADCAYRLLYNFGSKPDDGSPALGQEGRWHTLAKKLYGGASANLHKYLETSGRPTTLLLDEGAFAVTIGPFTRRGTGT